MKRKITAGSRFTRLVILEPSFSPRRAIAVCDCGTFKMVDKCHLGDGHTQSCGCLRIDVNREFHTKHGCNARGKRTPEYTTWASIKSRCYNLNIEDYKDYGGRGITVCDRWRESFENFYADMGPRPSRKHSIERNDTNGNYEPGNCRWATAKEQANNKRNNIFIPYGGVVYPLRELACLINMPPRALEQRIFKHGYDIEIAVTASYPHTGKRLSLP